jgi:hypothetical protein
MNRGLALNCALCFLLTASPSGLFAQFNPNANRFNPFAQPDPRVRRAYREKAVAVVGQRARDFVETHGDEAVVAIFGCSKAVASKLVDFHESGELATLPRPRDLLRTIGQPGHGNDVARWAMHHAEELADADNFDAFLMTPLDYSLGLKDLATGAAELRSRRLHLAAMTTPLPVDERLVIAGGAGVVVIILILLWRRRQSRF